MSAAFACRWRRAAVAGLVIAAGSVTGCASKSGADAKASPAAEATLVSINSTCPVAGDAFDSRAVTAKQVRTRNGKTIGFCCPACAKDYDKMTEAQKDEVLARAEANRSG